MRNDEVVIRFGAFRLLPAQRQLTRDGAPVPLGSRAMDLLLHLTAHAGEIVSKRALMQAVWPDRIVEENNLTVHMAALRRALDDTVEGRPLIQTVSGRGYMFVGATVVEAEAPRPASVPAPLPTVLPGVPQPATRLIGRDTAMAELKQLLQSRRIVSIVGPGGVGKTALALHLATEVAADFPDGVAFSDLSTITDPARVPEAVASGLADGAGVNTATARLTAFLRDHKSLLVLDNCEHVVEPVALLVSAILAACPGVVVLVTSREGLFLQGEQIFRLPPLRFPEEPQKADAATALGYGAVRLFVERAEAQGGFVLDDASAPAVASICARLDGIPLAIEMAVPRLKVLSPAQLAEGLSERFRLLGTPGRGTTPRHRTLQAMIDWSYDFLPPEERALLRCLSTFSGSASLASIQAVAGASDTDGIDLLDRLTGLADKSLLTVESSSPPRFRLLETVRQYAIRKVVEAGETDLQRRHAAHFADRFAEAARTWPTTPGREWLASYAPDGENLRSALASAFGPDGNPDVGLRIVASTVPLWWELPETPVAEGQRWLAAASSRLKPDTPAAVQGWVRFGLSWRDFRFSDRENLPAALDAAALFREADDAAGLGAALWRAGSALLTRETMDQSEACLVEAESVLRGIAPGKWLALTLIRLGDLWFRRDRLAEALASYREGYDLSRATDFWIGLVNGGSNMVELLYSTGETDRALQQMQDLRDELPPSRRTPLMATLARLFLLEGDMPGLRRTAIEVFSQGSVIGLTSAVAWAVETVALVAATEGHADLAARLAGYARSVHPSIGTRAGSTKVIVERLYGLLEAGLAPAALELALAEGGRWSLATAAGRAREVLGPDPARAN
ncbi:MAG: winged helix-turn-helix domain-containing protein [Alphaproteobacteria bacterium]|nr:winged helix-turn-helix domain-containing protein [Alphaproteobacteria bacterium]